MLDAGLELSRRRLDVCMLNEAGELVAQTAAAPDADGLRHLVMRVQAGRVRAVIESMNGARFVHDTLEELGWDVLIADAQKVKGLAPLACKTDKIDARVLAELSWRDLVPAIWLPDPSIRRERELARYREAAARDFTDTAARGASPSCTPACTAGCCARSPAACTGAPTIPTSRSLLGGVDDRDACPRRPSARSGPPGQLAHRHRHPRRLSRLQGHRNPNSSRTRNVGPHCVSGRLRHLIRIML